METFALFFFVPLMNFLSRRGNYVNVAWQIAINNYITQNKIGT